MIKKFKLFENNVDPNDPYNEEDWNDYEIVDIKNVDDLDIGDDVFTKTGNLFGTVIEKLGSRIIIKTPRGSLFSTSNNVKLYLYGLVVKKIKI